MEIKDTPVALITGGAQRIGAEITQQLHQAGYRVLIHYGRSESQAARLANQLNQIRPDSAHALQADLDDVSKVQELALAAQENWQRIDVLVNNASRFYPTPMGSVDMEQYQELFGSNFLAPLFLTQALMEALQVAGGCVVNIVDIHSERPLKNHPVYCSAKAALAMLTKSLAKELAPAVRVNGVSPGAILWPEAEPLDASAQQDILGRTPLSAQGEPQDIAEAVLFLVGARYMTGQIFAVDGGRTLTQ